MSHASQSAGGHVAWRRVADLHGMNCFCNVLLVAGTDDGPVPRQAFDRALSVAKRTKAKLTLMGIVHEPELFREILPLEMLEAARRHRRQSLRRLADKAQEQGVEVETEFAVGKPFLEIVRKVKSSKHDLVVTDGGPAKGPGWVIDSTTMHLMRKCPSAIWVVRPHSVNRYTRVLAAIDPQATDPEKDSLNGRIMELAISMAKLEGGDLHVVHVSEPHGIPEGSSAEVGKRWEMTARSEISRPLYEFLAPYNLGRGPRVHLVAGKPAICISELASEENIDLLVMGTVCRTGVRGFFIGNTVEEVLRRIDCSLLTVKPESFVSPIQLGVIPDV